MPELLVFHENTPQETGLEVRREITATADYLNSLLRPRRPVAVINGEIVNFRNMVGSARLSNGTIIEVMPKVRDTPDWASAVVQLLEPNTRIAVTGSQRSQLTAHRGNLSSAIALEYARRLESALSSEGPLRVYERQHCISRRLSGRLDVTKWVRSSILNPASFPVGRDELTPENDFARGLSLVAGWLGRAADDGALSSRLRRLQAAVIPGFAVPAYVNPSIAQRPMPTQWGKYGPAWDIAAPLLRHRSPVGDPGRAPGLEVAVEPWPLLETALTRALQTLAQFGSGYELFPKTRYPLLCFGGRSAVSVVPDGALLRHGRIVATFEAKYTVPGPNPSENHVHQALTTAAALSSPVSVLVYPGDQFPKRYTVTGFQGTPVALYTVGLRLFSYVRGVGDKERAHIVSEILSQSQNSEC